MMTAGDMAPIRLAAAHRTAITATMRELAQELILDHGEDPDGYVSVLVDRQDGDMTATLRRQVPESPVWAALDSHPGWYLVVVTWAIQP